MVYDVIHKGGFVNIQLSSSVSVFLNLLQEVRSVSAQVVVIATVWYRNHLNQFLLQSRGFHVFDKTLELHPPTLVSDLTKVYNYRCEHFISLSLSLSLSLSWIIIYTCYRPNARTF